MPVYNAGLYIRESIESVLEQTFTDFEFIIVDDGSTDKSTEIIRDYKDDRIRLTLNRHDYIDSLNRGMNSARGKYIARMDADDKMVPQRLQVQYEFMENNPEVDICGGYMETFGTRTTKMMSQTEPQKILAEMLLTNPMFHPTILMKRDLIKNQPVLNDQFICYDPDYIYAEDYKLWVDLAKQGCIFANIPETLLYYRISDNQNTNIYKKEMMIRTAQIQQEYMQYVITRICNYNPAFEDVFIPLIRLYNQKEISFIFLRKMIYFFYQDIVLKD